MPPPDELPPVAGAKLAPDGTCAGIGWGSGARQRVCFLAAREGEAPAAAERPVRRGGVGVGDGKRSEPEHADRCEAPDHGDGEPSRSREAPLPLDETERAGTGKRREHVRQVDGVVDRLHYRPHAGVPAEPDRLGRRNERGERCHARYHCLRHDVGNGNRYGNDDRGACRRRDHRQADVSSDRHVRLAHRAVVSGARNPDRDIGVRRLILRSGCVLILRRILPTVPDPRPVLRNRSRGGSSERYHGQIRIREAVPLPGPRVRIVLRARRRSGSGLRCRRRGLRAGRRARSGRGGRGSSARAGTAGARCRRDGRRDIHLRDGPVVARAPDPDADVEVGRRGLHGRGGGRRRRSRRCGDTSRGIGGNRRGIRLGWGLDGWRLDRRHGLDRGRSARCGGRRGIRRSRLLRRLRRLAESVVHRALDRGARLPREHRAGVERRRRQRCRWHGDRAVVGQGLRGEGRRGRAHESGGNDTCRETCSRDRRHATTSMQSSPIFYSSFFDVFLDMPPVAM